LKRNIKLESLKSKLWTELEGTGFEKE